MKHAAILLALLFASVKGFDFGTDSDFFEDLDGGDKDAKAFFNDENDNNEQPDDSVFVSESTNKLQDGREMITRESEAWVTDPTTGKEVQKKLLKHFVKYPNGTVVEVAEDEASGDRAKVEDQVTAVECITEGDCKDNQFCDRLSFSCKSCFKTNETCHKQRECCQGLICREGKCDSITGKDGDPCDDDKDCKPNHCCASQDGKDVCRPYLEEGEVCSDGGGFLSPRFPSFFTRKFIQNERRRFCPCLSGLQCKKQDSYFLMQPKTCTAESKTLKVKKQKKTKKHHKKHKHNKQKEEIENEIREEMEDERAERRDALEHEDRIDDDNEDDEDDDDDDDKDERRDDDDDDEREDEEDIRDSIMDRLPRMLRGIIGRFLG